jgi:hypothetical protein
MKYTLLEITQEILSDMDSDEVNSIDDTTESEQVATIVKSTYLSMMANRNWPHTRKLVTVETTGGSAYPTHVSIKENVKELCFLNYNKAKQGETRKKYLPVKFVEPDEFLRRTNHLNNDNDNVDIITDFTGIELLIQNNKAPDFCTSFDDEIIVFDSYDSNVESTIQVSKVQAMAYVVPEWTHLDDAVPDLPEDAFPALIEEAKSRAAFRIGKFQDVKAEQESGRQQRWLARKARKINGGIKYPDYGRTGRKRGRDSTFRQDR